MSRVTVQNTAAAGLNGAWAFDEGSGTTTADQSGQGQHRHGFERDVDHRREVQQRALVQRHGNTWVTVADSATLDLTTGHDDRGVGAADDRRAAGARRS